MGGDKQTIAQQSIFYFHTDSFHEGKPPE